MMPDNQRLHSLPLLLRNDVQLTFGEESFVVICRNDRVRIERDDDNFAQLNLKNNEVAYKARILGGYSQFEERKGVIDYQGYFLVDWQEEASLPELVLLQQPDEIRREYRRGQRLELGVEKVTGYRIVYRDDTVADFVQTGRDAFDFNFTSGFAGNFWKDEDGNHAIRFKGIRMDAEDDDYNSESKFIISRSKYTDNLVLILQDAATVYLTI